MNEGIDIAHPEESIQLELVHYYCTECEGIFMAHASNPNKPTCCPWCAQPAE